jgi:hypothetical protein
MWGHVETFTAPGKYFYFDFFLTLATPYIQPQTFASVAATRESVYTNKTAPVSMSSSTASDGKKPTGVVTANSNGNILRTMNAFCEGFL